MTDTVNEIGLAIVGCGTIGRIRAKYAREYPGVKWLGLADINEPLGRKLAEDTKADFFTTSAEELIKRPEVNAVMIITEENKHTEPTLLAVEQGHKLFIEKPLATEARESKQILDAITGEGLDACIGYTQRFRRRFLTVKERLQTGQIGDVHSVVTRAFMNRMVPIATIAKTNERHNLTPMVVSGTHSLDMSMWLMEGKTPKSIYAKSVDPVLSEWGTKDSTFGIFTMDDDTIFSMNISWGLPEVWPGAVYGLEIGIVGSKGAIDIEDTHRRLRAGRVRARRTPRRIHDQLPARRSLEQPALRSDARRNHRLVQPHHDGPADAARLGARRSQQPHAHHGHGPLRKAGRRSSAAYRSGRILQVVAG